MIFWNKLNKWRGFVLPQFNSKHKIVCLIQKPNGVMRFFFFLW